MALFENLKDDKRLVNYFIKNRQMTEKEYRKKVEGLEDLSHLVDKIRFEDLAQDSSASKTDKEAEGSEESLKEISEESSKETSEESS